MHFWDQTGRPIDMVFPGVLPMAVRATFRDVMTGDVTRQRALESKEDFGRPRLAPLKPNASQITCTESNESRGTAGGQRRLRVPCHGAQVPN